MVKPNRDRFAVPLGQLRRTCDPTVTALPLDADGVIGQERAMASIALGLRMASDDYAKSHYNIVVVGPANTGRTAKTRAFVERHAAGIAASPPDVVCLHDFAAPRRPIVAFVPNGKAKTVKAQVKALAMYAVNVVPAKLAALKVQQMTALNEEVNVVWKEVNDELAPVGFTLLEGEDQPTLAPLSPDRPGEVLTQEEFDALTQEGRADLASRQEQAIRLMTAALMRIQSLAAVRIAEHRAAQKQFVDKAFAKKTAPLKRAVGKNVEIARFLDGFIEAATAVATADERPKQRVVMLGGSAQPEADERQVLLKMCEVNTLVDNAGVAHPPVVHVTVPQYSELFGRVQAHVVGADGSIRIDHTMLQGGAFMRANGGYLILDLGDLLRWGGGIAFYKLLKVLRTRTMAIEAKSRFMDAEMVVDFRSDDVPVDVRVIVICDRWLEHLLREHEPEFDNLFRITAEFDSTMGFESACPSYRAFVELCRADHDLPEFAPEAVAKLVEYGVRRAGDRTKASTEFGIIKDVITEAAYWSRAAGAEIVDPAHVQQAIDARFERQALAVRRYEEHLDRGTLILHHDGERVGQVNGLAVMAVSREVRFGTPLRITARAYAGKERVVLVQREAKLSGPSSTTAVAVIRGYLSGQYGRKKPIGVSVQLCFEQCYGGIDGDSASLAETIAVISAITGLPVDQRLAVTGSMDQWGAAQPIGGVNEKIEGHFFALDRLDILKRGHGIVMPRTNLDNLMLHEAVVDAQRKGLYQVYAVDTIDDALEIFLGRPAAEVHALVEENLAAMCPDTSDEDDDAHPDK